MTELALEFDNTPEDAHAILIAATGFLEIEGAYDPDIELALAEAINNVVDHAYTTQGHAELFLETSASDIVCILTDSGKTYIPPPVGKTPGYGWHLMRTIAKEVNIYREQERNQLRLCFQRPAVG